MTFSLIEPHNENRLPETLGKPLPIPTNDSPTEDLPRLTHIGPVLDSTERRGSVVDRHPLHTPRRRSTHRTGSVRFAICIQRPSARQLTVFCSFRTSNRSPREVEDFVPFRASGDDTQAGDARQGQVLVHRHLLPVASTCLVRNTDP